MTLLTTALASDPQPGIKPRLHCQEADALPIRQLYTRSVILYLVLDPKPEEPVLLQITEFSIYRNGNLENLYISAVLKLH